MNRNELIAEMKRHGDRQEDLAEYIGISPQRFSMKVNGKDGAEFTRPEIQKIQEKYNLSAEQVFIIFFASNVSQKETS